MLLLRYNVHLAPFNAAGLTVDVDIMMGVILAQDEKLQKGKSVSRWCAHHTS